MTSKQLVLGKERLRPMDVAAVARGELTLAIAEDASVRKAWEATRAALERRLASGAPLYGITTGFGASCENQVDPELADALTTNLFRYHGCGLGPALGEVESAAVLACRLAQLASGWSGVRVETLEALCAMLAHRVLPRIPAWGSVGASGDLTPLSYVAAVLSGEREAIYAGEVLPAAEALARAGLAAHKLAPKESLSIMNGTSVMTALACLGLERATRFARAHAACVALVIVAVSGNVGHYDERLFVAKAHPGSATYARWLRAWLGVQARPAPRDGGRIQDPYSLRCSPHAVGVLVDALGPLGAMLEIELNGAGDNPLVCPETGDVLHGGNFYGGHVTYACDGLKTLVASSAEVLERQIVLMNQPRTSGGLPENLVLAAGPERVAHHGFKAVEILASSLVADALKRTGPAMSLSRSTEGHNQDKVPMGSIAARELGDVLELCEAVLAATFACAAQAVDAGRGPAALPPSLARVYAWVRRSVTVNTADRRQDQDLARLLAAYREAPLGTWTAPYEADSAFAPGVDGEVAS